MFGNNRPTVVGWGRTNNSWRRPVSSAQTDVQQKLVMSVRNNEDCLALFRDKLGVNLTGEIRCSQHDEKCLKC